MKPRYVVWRDCPRADVAALLGVLASDTQPQAPRWRKPLQLRNPHQKTGWKKQEIKASSLLPAPSPDACTLQAALVLYMYCHPFFLFIIFYIHNSHCNCPFILLWMNVSYIFNPCPILCPIFFDSFHFYK